MRINLLIIIFTITLLTQNIEICYCLRPIATGGSPASIPSPAEEYPDHLKPFYELTQTLSNEISRMTNEIEELLNNKDTDLVRILESIEFSSHMRDLTAQEPEKTQKDRRMRTAKELIQGYMKNIREICGDIPLTTQYDSMLDKIFAQVLKIISMTSAKLGSRQQQSIIGDFQKKLEPLRRGICIIRNLSAVLRNSRHFANEDFEDDLVRFTKDPKTSFVERLMVANAFLFIKNTTAGIIALLSEESRQNMRGEDYTLMSTVIGIGLDDCISIKGEGFIINAGMDLCLQFLDKDTDPIGAVELLIKFVYEYNIDLSFIIGQSLKNELVEKLLDLGNAANQFYFIRKLSYILAGIDPQRALQVVTKEEPEKMAYPTFEALESYLTRGSYAPEVAPAIKKGLQKKLASCSWPRLGPKDLEAHRQSKEHKQLCHNLEMANKKILKFYTGFLDAFKAYYPEEDEHFQREKAFEALGAAHQAMSKLPRELLLIPIAKPWVSIDDPLHIPMGHKQTISQPSLVYASRAVLNPKKTDRVLEIGTGSGYQASVLAEVAKEVHTIEVYEDLAEGAQATCRNLGIDNIKFYKGDGSGGLEQKGPFDIIIVTAGAPATPEPLLEQLSENGGRLLIAERQKIPRDPTAPYKVVLYIRQGKKSYKKIDIVEDTRWVPLVGKAGRKEAGPYDKQLNLGPPQLLEEPEKVCLGYNQDTVPVVTPLKKQGDKIIIDREGIRRYLKHLISIGVRSILVMGATGEFQDFTNDERMEAIRIFAEESRGRFTIFANATAEDETTTKKNIQELNKMPYISAVVVAPLCYLENNLQAFLHLRSIESELPVVLYNNPGIHRIKGRNIRPLVVRALKKDLAGIKDSSGKLGLLRKYAKHLPTFQGDEMYITEALKLGAVGAVSSMGNALSLPQEIFEEGRDNLEKTALQIRIINLVRPLTADRKKTPAALKYYLWLIGVLPDYTVKNPKKELNDTEKENIEKVRSELSPPAPPQLITTSELAIIDKLVTDMVEGGHFDMDKSPAAYEILADTIRTFIQERYYGLNKVTGNIIDENLKHITSVIHPESVMNKPNYDLIWESYSYLEEVNFYALRDLMIICGEIAGVLAESVIKKYGDGSPEAERAYTSFGGFLVNFNDQIKNICISEDYKKLSDEMKERVKDIQEVFKIYYTGLYSIGKAEDPTPRADDDLTRPAPLTPSQILNNISAAA